MDELKISIYRGSGYRTEISVDSGALTASNFKASVGQQGEALASFTFAQVNTSTVAMSLSRALNLEAGNYFGELFYKDDYDNYDAIAKINLLIMRPITDLS